MDENLSQDIVKALLLICRRLDNMNDNLNNIVRSLQILTDSQQEENN